MARRSFHGIPEVNSCDLGYFSHLGYPDRQFLPEVRRQIFGYSSLKDLWIQFKKKTRNL